MLMLEDKLMNIDYKFDIDEDEEIGFFEETNDDWDTIIGRIEDGLSAELFDRFDSYELETGATKAVIIPKNYSYVIKIPLNGQWIEKYNEDLEDYEDEYEFQYFHGGDNGENNWDYCAREVEIYEEAKCSGMSKYFAETKYWKSTHGNYPMYLQEKCQMNSNTRPSQKSMEKAQEVFLNDNNIVDWEFWIASFIDFYGLAAYNEFIKWLNSDEIDGLINDLTDRNLGFRCSDNAPVVVDYSGYWERGD